MKNTSIILVLLFTFFSSHAQDCQGVYPNPNYNTDTLNKFITKMNNNSFLRVQTLCTTNEGRTVRKLLIGTTNPKMRVLITARHHANEMKSNWILESLMENILTESTYGKWLRENVEFFIVPIVDLDGVEKGEPGKNRAPHDHNRDYVSTNYPFDKYTTPIYEEITAIMNQVPAWSAGKMRFAIDMHCPGGGQETGDLVWHVTVDNSHCLPYLRWMTDATSNDTYKTNESIKVDTWTNTRSDAWAARQNGVLAAMVMEGPQCGTTKTMAALYGKRMSQVFFDYFSNYLVPFTKSNPNDIIVDNTDSAYIKKVGTWEVSSGLTSCYNKSYLYKNTGAEGSFTVNPPLNQSGFYTVYGWWPFHDSRSTSLPIIISGGSTPDTTVHVNQRDRLIGGRWFRLGRFYLTKGKTSVTISTKGINTVVNADAFRFVGENDITTIKTLSTVKFTQRSTYNSLRVSLLGKNLSGDIYNNIFLTSKTKNLNLKNKLTKVN